MPKKFYTSLPEGYPICQHADCKMAQTCLHQLAYEPLLETDNILYLINPNKCSKDENCENYRDCKPVVYARGFAHFQKRMFPDQYQQFMSILVNTFSRNGYFERRRGDTALSPKEQDIVLSALRQVGVTEELKFKSYEENTNWYD